MVFNVIYCFSLITVRGIFVIKRAELLQQYEICLLTAVWCISVYKIMWWCI